MKAGLLCLVQGIFVLVLGCRPAADSNDAGAHAEMVNPDAPEIASIREAGESAAQKLAAALLPELLAAIEAAGPEGAIGFCHSKVLPLSRGSHADEPKVIAVKRTSLRVRNPDNAPDEAETLALEHVQSLIDAGGTAPPRLVQRLGPPYDPQEWRVYRPLTVMPLCVTCHGDSAGFSPELREAIAQAYPSDRATGYEEGDWRGLIRVSVRPDEGA